jgi:hypothetical protein
VRPIPERLLIASGAFPVEAARSARLPADAVAAAIARGIERAHGPAPLLCPLTTDDDDDPRALLDELGFDASMRSSRAVVIAWRQLDERTLAGSAAFEIATRARQAGVPAYAVTARNELDAFDARMLDLQAILEARTARELAAAGAELTLLA